MDLIHDNLRKVFSHYLFTALGSSVIVSIYSSVDIICVGHYCGPVGTAAISCVNPLWSVMIAPGLLFGVGGAIRMTNRRGAGDPETGSEYFTAALAAGFFISLLMTAFFLFRLDAMLRFFGADDTLLPYARSYAKWIALSVPSFFMGSLLSSFVRNDGAPGLCTAAILTGGILNMFGDVYFVFDFGLGMGMSGAGLATALGQTVAVLLICSYFFRKKCALRLKRCADLFRKLGRIIASGFAIAVVDLTFGVTVVLFNRQIMRYAGASELAIFGTVSNIAILFQSLFYGVGQAVQPITSANFGAGDMSRVRGMRGIYLLTSAAMSGLFFALAEAFPKVFLKIYMSVDNTILVMGSRALRIYAVSFLFMGVNVVSTYFLESILHSRQSLVISLSRGMVLAAVFAFLLPALFGIHSIWFAMPAAEFLTFLYAGYSVKYAPELQ